MERSDHSYYSEEFLFNVKKNKCYCIYICLNISVYLWFVLSCSTVTWEVQRANLQHIFFGATGESPVKGHRNDWGTGVSLLWWKAGRPGTAQPGEGSRDISSMCINPSQEVAKRTESGSFLWTRGNGHQWKHRRFLLNIRKHFLNCEADQALAQIDQSGCGVSLNGDA